MIIKKKMNKKSQFVNTVVKVKRGIKHKLAKCKYGTHTCLKRAEFYTKGRKTKANADWTAKSDPVGLIPLKK